MRGKIVLITGASSGIGKATAVKVADAGATVLLVARSVDKLEETKDEIEAAGGVAHIHRCDMSDIEDIERMAEEVLAYHGHVDILVNNAGPLDPPLGRALLRPLPRLRADDAAQLLRRAAADPGPAADDAGAQVGPHHQHQLDRRRRPTRRASPPTSPRRRRSTPSAA